MKIPMINPAEANKSFLKELEQAAIDVIRSGSYILGPEVNTFEKDIAKYLRVKHAIGMSSGTDALLAAMMVYDIGYGDEVICPSFTFFATAGSIARVGAVPVFVDIMKDCFTISCEEIEKAITPKTKAIMPVHLFGQSADMDGIMGLAKKYNLIVIEDACQAIGTEYSGHMVGTIGDVGCFSFFPTKNLGGVGDSGLVVTNDDNVYEKLKSARNHGSKIRYFHDFVGGNFRIDTIQAAMLSVKLKYFAEQERVRVEHAARYSELFSSMGLNEEVVSWPRQIRGTHKYNQYTLRVMQDKRDSLMSHLANVGIGSAIYYPLPLHRQVCFSTSNSIHHSMLETDLAAKEVLSIPISSEVKESEIDIVAQEIVRFSNLV